MNTVVALKKSREYIDAALKGGALAGKNVIVKSIEPIEGGNKITFGYTLDDGTEMEQSFNVMDGVDGQDGTTYKPEIGTVTIGQSAAAGIDIDEDNKVAKFNFTLPSSSATMSGSYNDLSDKPKINGIELVGDISLEELGVVSADVTIAGIPIGDGITKEDLKEKLGVYDNIGDFPDASDYLKNTDAESEDIDFNSFDW